MYERVNLSIDANVHVGKVLSRGHSLAKLLSRHPGLGTGEVFSFLPPDVEPAATRQFTRGGIAQADESEGHLVTFIHDFLTSGEGKLCIFQDALSATGAAGSSPTGIKTLTYRREVYRCLSEGDEREGIRQTIQRAQTLPRFLAVLTSLPKGEGLYYESQPATLKLLSNLADRAEKIIVGAYNGEGHLIWNKP